MTLAAPLQAQPANPADPELDEGAPEADEEEVVEIIVQGRRERGAVFGDIAPELQLDQREIRAFGAGNLAELLEALAPQTRSARGRDGGGPVVLLNGRRISGFREIRNMPPEAIERVDILPEEVALKYGYRADQRVVNFVTRRRFRAITGEVETQVATAGGRSGYEADFNLLRINRNGRWSVDAEFRRDTALYESERDLIQDANAANVTDLGRYRTLLPRGDTWSINGTLNRTVFGDVSATVNAGVDGSATTARLGLPEGAGPLTRDSDTLAGHLGLSLSGERDRWNWSFTGNFDRSHDEDRTDAGLDLAGLQANPYAAMPRGIGPTLQDRSSSTAQTLDVDFVANGPVLELPAGQVSSTVRAGFQTGGFKSETMRAGIDQDRELSRNGGNFQASLDIPIADRGRGVLAAIGDLSANLNLEAEHLSDVGTLRTLGGGLNWSPIDEIDFIASYTDEEGAPTVEQLGDPAVATPNFRVFDFLTGETVEITRIEGGNAALRPDRRRVLKLGATMKPFEKTDLSLTANYVRSQIRDVIATFPTATREIEAAFPERFLRSESGRLIRIDSRPVNFASSDREELRWGLNFSKPLGPEPERPPGGWRPGGGAGGDQAARAARREARGSGRGGFGGGRFGGQGGRIQLALYHTWRLRDEVLIRAGVPKLDFLGGSAAGNTGGRPAHQLEFQAGLFRNGLGARLTADWQSGTVVRGGPAGPGGASGDLRFSDLATVNLRLFADLGRQRALAERFPWLRGTRVSLSVDNLFDARLGVRDATGATPLGYQPDYLDPLGRSVRITLRKLFF
jgi:hypothetical protein